MPRLICRAIPRGFSGRTGGFLFGKSSEIGTLFQLRLNGFDFGKRLGIGFGDRGGILLLARGDIRTDQNMRSGDFLRNLEVLLVFTIEFFRIRIGDLALGLDFLLQIFGERRAFLRHGIVRDLVFVGIHGFILKFQLAFQHLALVFRQLFEHVVKFGFDQLSGGLVAVFLSDAEDQFAVDHAVDHLFDDRFELIRGHLGKGACGNLGGELLDKRLLGNFDAFPSARTFGRNERI